MSWSQITSNQEVTFNNLQDAVNTGVFTAKASIPASQKLITKTEANTYVYINTNYLPYLAKASNQLVVKGDLESAPPVTTTTTTSAAPLYTSRIYGIDQYSTSYLSTPTYGNLIYSDNGGLTWNSLNKVSYSAARDATGQYVLSAYGPDVQVSTNSGASFTNVTLPGNTSNVSGTAVSSSGQYMFVITYGGNFVDPNIYRSVDYGVNWAIVYTRVLGSSQSVIAPPFSKISVSGDGQYVAAFIDIRNNFFGQEGAILIRSTDFGASFTVAPTVVGIYWTDVAINSTGQYQLYTRMTAYPESQPRGLGGIQLSTDFGASSTTKIFETDFRALYCAMSTSGQRMLVAFIDKTDRINKFYFSTDFGATWGSFNTNPTPPLRGPMPGGVFVAPDGSYALITYVDYSEITVTTDFSAWYPINISPQAYKFGGLNESK